MRIVFLGTPDFAVKSLQTVINSKHELLAVVTQPDKMRDRGHAVSFSPVKEEALKHDIKVLQYNKIRVEGVDDLKALKPDLMITCAYGQIISQEILDIPPKGVINVHASLLPKFRGSSPIQWAILKGEKTTGVTIMKTALSVDSGDILLQRKLDILPKENAGQLFDRLADLGAETLKEALDIIESNKEVYTKQDESKATHYPMLSKADGKIDWSKTSHEIYCKVYGLTPWPSAYCTYNNKMFKISDVDEVTDFDTTGYSFGEVVERNKNVYVVCKDGAIKLNTVQLEGKKSMNINDFMLGNRFNKGDILV